MIGFLKGLLTAPKVVDGIMGGIKHIATEIDESKLTDEEKAKLHVKLIEMQIGSRKGKDRENTLFEKSRRFLMKIVCYPVILYSGSAVILYPINEMYSSFVYVMVKEIFFWPWMSIMALYFVPSMIPTNRGK